MDPGVGYMHDVRIPVFTGMTVEFCMIYIIIPAYNEAENISRVIRDLFQHGYKNIVVVDDGSIDDTYVEAKKSGVSILRHEINRGQGAALQTGNEFALANGAETIAHFDADEQMNVEDIKRAVDKIQKEKLDIVLGSRFLVDAAGVPWTKRLIILPVARFLNNFFSGLKLTDAHNGFRVMTKSAAEKIRITQDGMAHNSEIPAQIKKNNLSYAEIPVNFAYKEYGQGVGGGMKVLRDLFVGVLIK